MELLNKSWIGILPPRCTASALRILAIAGLFRTIRAWDRRILFDNLFGPDFFRGFLILNRRSGCFTRITNEALSCIC